MKYRLWEHLGKDQVASTPTYYHSVSNLLFGLRVLHEPRITVTEARQTFYSTNTKTVKLCSRIGSFRGRNLDMYRLWPFSLHEDKKSDDARISILGYNDVFAAQNSLRITEFGNQLLWFSGFEFPRARWCCIVYINDWPGLQHSVPFRRSSWMGQSCSKSWSRLWSLNHC